MSSNFTSDEIQAAVQKLVLSAIRQPYDTLGVRRTDVTFTDVQQAAASVFILYPNSPFYVLALGFKRLNDTINAEAQLLDELIAAVQATGRKVLPVSDVSPLFNAQAALQELGTAAARRGGIYADITKAPAYQRYTTNVDNFLNGPGQAVRENGAIVQTPQQARQVISGLLTQVASLHTTLIDKVTSLSNGLTDYAATNLPAVVIASILSNSAALVGADAAALNGLTPEERLAQVRQVVLNLLTTKAVVRTFGSFSGPSDYYSLDGIGHTYSDLQHPAQPAAAVSTFGGAYSVVTGSTDVLTLTVDGGAPVNLTLNPGLVAELDGSANDSTFVIGDGTKQLGGTGSGYPNNNVLKLQVDTTTYVATLTQSGLPTAPLLIGTGDLTNAALYGVGGTLDGTTFSVLSNDKTVKSVTLVAPTDSTNLVVQIRAVFDTGPDNVKVFLSGNFLELNSLATGSAATLRIQAGTANAPLGFVTDAHVRGLTRIRTADQVATDINAVLPADVRAEGFYLPMRYSGTMDIPAGVDTTWTLNPLGVSDLVALGVVAGGDSVRVTQGANVGIYLITAVTANTITVLGNTVLQAGAVVEIGPANRRLRIRCVNPAVQVPAETTISVFGDDEPSKNALTTLGFANGLFSQCGKATPETVAADINSKTGLVSAGTKVLTLAGPFTAARTDTTNPSLVVMMTAGASGTTTFIGPQVTFTVTAVDVNGTVSVNDTMALRGGPSPGHGYVISTINGGTPTGHALAVGDVIVAVGAFAGAGSVNVPVEFGPTLSPSKYQVITIDGGPNGGTYAVQGPGDTAIDVLIQRTFVQVKSVTSPTTAPLRMTASLGDNRLTLTSKNVTTASSIQVSGTAAPLFFNPVPYVQLGSSSWFQLPSIPRNLQAGDVLEYFPTDYQNPANSYTIRQIVAGLTLIEVGPDANGAYIPNSAGWQFTVQPPPFARLRVGTKNNFTTVQASLAAWLANAVNQPQYLENLNRLINPLLVNTNPTADAVGTAVAALNQFYAYLTTAQATAILGTPAAALQSILQTYTVEQVQAVDALLKTFLAKGSDRAADLLLLGKFTDFFNLTQEQASYAGAFQAAARDVALNDLPVRKINRSEAVTARLLAQAPSPDFEFSANSIDETAGPQVDPPTSFGAPSNFGTKIGSQGAH